MAVRDAPRVLMLATVDVTIAKLLMPLLEALRAAGYHVEAASADGPDARWVRTQGIPVHVIPFTRRVLAASHLSALLALRRLMHTRRYDVVHVHTPVAQVLGRMAARWSHVPVVIYTSHGYQFHESRRRPARWAILTLERWLGRWATDFIFTQSQEDAATTVSAGIVPSDRVQWIGNGVDISRFAPASRSGALRADLGLDPQDRAIGFVGRIVREKGILDLAQAMISVRSRIPRAKLIIVGDTLASDADPLAKTRLQEIIARGGLARDVIFAGYRQDIPHILAHLDLFVLPSWREGMPRTVLEAMACGLPVVATDIRGCREEVAAGETGVLVPPHDPAALAEAIVQVLRDPDRARAMGTKGRARAVDLFDERLVIERQLRVYRRLLADKGLALAAPPAGEPAAAGVHDVGRP